MSAENEKVTPPNATGTMAKPPFWVGVITAFCVLQFLGLVAMLVQHHEQIVQRVVIGAQSPLAFILMLTYPLILFLAGIWLFRMRQSAVYFFMMALVWGLAKAFTATEAMPPYLSLTIALGAVFYCHRLKAKGLLH